MTSSYLLLLQEVDTSTEPSKEQRTRLLLTDRLYEKPIVGFGEEIAVVKEESTLFSILDGFLHSATSRLSFVLRPAKEDRLPNDTRKQFV
jgi:hypothetical protein